MDKRGVLLKFLKLHKAIPSVKSNFYKKNPKIWLADEANDYKFRSVDAKTFFDFYLNKYGFIRGFEYIMSEIDASKYHELYDKWRYFINNNVYLNPTNFSVEGLYAKLPYRYLRPCKIIENKGYRTLVEITVDNCPEKFLINSDEVFLENGERANLNYYLKIRGKEFGLK